MTTLSAKSETVAHHWYIVDAKGKTLGRLATEIARRLRGKHKPEYTPHVDTGDYIIVVNASQVRVTGNKAQDKTYHWHTGYPGGIREINFEGLMKKNPCSIITQAVKGMLPKNPLGRKMLGKLRVYPESQHDHVAQQPELIEF